MELFKELKQLVSDCEVDANKFYGKGNSAAGTRMRNSMQAIKAKCQEIRIDVMEVKKAGDQ